ncbi:Ribosomal protein L7Ae [Ruminococcaceae bacterium YRB3002]|nr:Ribosomal protein L7Ae [Ruminococcaceae bacterium YRB3002]
MTKKVTKENILQFMGLARRAGKLESGTDSVLAAMRNGSAKLLILSKDLAPGTVSRVIHGVTYEIPMYRFATMDELGKAIGTVPRGVIAITDKGFADKLDEKLTDYEEDED